jgi:hypothetical protein
MTANNKVPITMASLVKSRTVVYGSKSGIVASNPAREWKHVCVSSTFVLSCICRDFTRSRTSSRGSGMGNVGQY